MAYSAWLYIKLVRLFASNEEPIAIEDIPEILLCLVANSVNYFNQ